MQDKGAPGGPVSGAAALAGLPQAERRRRARRPVPRKLSEILTDLASDPARERVTLGDLVEAMDGRAFGALLLVFAIPNALPAIPGTSGILGLPLLFLAAQMMLGRAPWLPRFISARGMGLPEFAALTARVTPWLARADRLTASRLHPFVDGWAERVLGLVCLVLALVVALPIPFGNMLPAFSICMIALGVLERDGLWTLLGTIVGTASVVLVSGVIYALALVAWSAAVTAFQ